ncbi:MAG: tRNA (guanosine(37)-N1)-methyltransferase TrmD [Chloroflexi bacterium]|nr:tRNA (guanosine(37)-N1)-methyltransferase TrmD [Chloroflexota bacterium]
MRFDILTLFPGMFRGPFEESILKRARERGLVEVNIYNIREYATDKHHVVDDYPYGGGAGMVMKPEPVYAALEAVKARGAAAGLAGVAPALLLTPQGEPFCQSMARELAQQPWLILLCGHYEGVDERIREHMATREVSIGDYVLAGGELPAMVVVEAVARLVPGVMGSPESGEEESFGDGLLEYPQYTRPAAFREWQAPEVLLSGNHQEVRRWRRQQALLRTARRRPDLYAMAHVSLEERVWVAAQLAREEP